jgi:hypothetical protein
MEKPERPNKRLPRAEGTSHDDDSPFISHLAYLPVDPSLPTPSYRLLRPPTLERMADDGGLRGLGRREWADEASLGQEMVVEGKKGAVDFASWTRLL